jgi:predicted TIM-barrel fold metal-dependent hydrolase
MRENAPDTAQEASNFEPIIEPDLPIVDAHHHLWVLGDSFFSRIEAGKDDASRRASRMMRGYARYMLDEYLSDVRTGHNVRASIYMEADPMRPMYRSEGAEEKRSLGEVEFANGMAAVAASEYGGGIKVASGIVGYVDLNLGERQVEELLDAHQQAAIDRYRGIRRSTPSSKLPHVLLDAQFRRGFKCLSRRGLSFDALVFTQELPELLDLARAFSETAIIVDHFGWVGEGGNLNAWRESIRHLALCPNVTMKLGGLGMSTGLKTAERSARATSIQLAQRWRPYFDACVESFGADRCMLESNFPIDSPACSYPVLWNAFKRLAAGASAAEKRTLFSATACRVYRITI